VFVHSGDLASGKFEHLLVARYSWVGIVQHDPLSIWLAGAGECVVVAMVQVWAVVHNYAADGVLLVVAPVVGDEEVGRQCGGLDDFVLVVISRVAEDEIDNEDLRQVRDCGCGFHVGPGAAVSTVGVLYCMWAKKVVQHLLQ